MAARLGRDDVIVAGVLQGRPRSQIAGQAGISERTLRRRLNEPDMIALIVDAREEQHRKTLGRLTALSATALDRLGAILACDDPGVQLRAVKLVLDAVPRYQAVAEDARLAQMQTVISDLETQMEAIKRWTTSPGD